MEVNILSFLEFQNVSYTSDNNVILKDISLNVASGDFVSIVGPSGSGKSTLLRLCGDLISPTLGDIIFEGKNYRDYKAVDLRKNIAYCFQTPYLFGDTVMENIEFPYYVRNIKPDITRIKSLFSMFDMSDDYLKRDVKNLSGGEKQRIALMRSILFRPKILLLDEVTSALDTDNTLIVEKVIASLHAEGATVLWVTHNPEQSRKYANKILTIHAGKIESFEEVVI